MNTALLPRAREPGWSGGGFNRRGELIFDCVACLFVTAFIVGWILAIIESGRIRREAAAEARSAGVVSRNVEKPPVAAVPEPATPPAPAAAVGNAISSSLLDPNAGSVAFLNDAAMKFFDPLKGLSGQLHLVTRTPGAPLTSASPDGKIQVQFGEQSGSYIVSPDFVAPNRPGLYSLGVKLGQATQAVTGLTVATLVPFSEKQQGRIGLYYLGTWPYESGGQPKTPAYANPAGFIEVTPENKDLYVSSHFKLGDFLTKGQDNVWPKYLLLNPKLLDKLELIIQDLEAHGHHVVHVQVMSGFRTPNYNYTGGNTEGRANLSRHMYGDAADIFVDNDRNGIGDDLNGDGKIDEHDAEVILAAAERVEQKYPALVGGVGVYAACCGHGPFTHVDVRGYRARWRGTGSG